MKVVGRVKPGCGYPEGDIVELEPGERLFYCGMYDYILYDKEGHEIAIIGKNYPYAYGFLILGLYKGKDPMQGFGSDIYLFDPRLIASCIKVTLKEEEKQHDFWKRLKPGDEFYKLYDFVERECVPFESLDEAVRYIREHLKTVNEDPVYEKDPATGFFCMHDIFKGYLTLL